jgi:hypothetical protein
MRYIKPGKESCAKPLRIMKFWWLGSLIYSHAKLRYATHAMQNTEQSMTQLSVQDIRNQKPLSRLTLTLLLLPLPLHLTSNLTHCSEQLTKPKAPPFNPHTPDKEVHQCPIADAEREKDAEVAPLIARLDVKRG